VPAGAAPVKAVFVDPFTFVVGRRVCPGPPASCTEEIMGHGQEAHSDNYALLLDGSDVQGFRPEEL
jgi:hypothetical protein